MQEIKSRSPALEWQDNYPENENISDLDIEIM